jgi:predicted lipoprotein with Yx(FWY)xxD motif
MDQLGIYLNDHLALATASVELAKRAAAENADSSLGEILVDGNGMTLYMFRPDAQGPSTCTEGCLEAWPMVHGPVTAGDGVDGALLGTAPRPEDGSAQATCDGWPLYTFAEDAAPGDVTGQGVGDNWYVLDATCTPVGMA